MAVSYTKEYKDQKKLEYKIAVRQGIFITDYVKTKYDKIFQEAAELYNTISSKYPCKPNILKTSQYRKWKNEILSENHRPARRVPRQRDRYYKTTLYPLIPAAENDNGSFNNTTSQTSQFVLQIPLLNHKITIYRRESLAELCHTLHCACSISWQVSCESFMRK